MNSGKGGRPETLTQTDVDMIAGLRVSGIRLNFIAHYVYGVSGGTLAQKLKGWNKRRELK